MMRTTTKLIGIAVILAAASSLGAAPAEAVNLTETFRGASAGVERLEVYEVSGIVLIRGRASSELQAEAVGLYARELGYERVANLIRIVRHDDAAIERAAQQELGMHRALDGCEFRVDSREGVLHLAGKVRHELQKDVALQVLKSVQGVQSIEAQFEKF